MPAFAAFSLLLVCFPLLGQAAARFTAEADTVARVLTLLDERLALMPGVAAAKWQRQAPIQDPAREQAVIEQAVTSGAALGLAEGGIRDLFALQIQLARDVQQQLHTQWRREGFNYPGPIPRLTEDIRPQLDGLTTDLLRALYLAAPACERENFAATYAPILHAYPHLAAAGPAATEQLLGALGSLRRVPMSAAARVQASGMLRIGSTGDYAPFSLDANGELSGADIELGLELAQALKLEPVFIRTSWPTLAADLSANRFDIAISGIAVTPERAQIGAFSRSYQTGGKTILARCTDVRRYRSLRRVDHAAVKVIVNPGGTNERYVRGNLHHAQVILFPDNRGIFEEIRAGRADVMITDDVEVELQTRRHPDLCRALAGTLTQASKAIFTTHDASLLPLIDPWLATSLANGEPQRLLQQALTAR